MGWDKKDAVGEPLELGDEVVYFRDKSRYNVDEGFDLGFTGTIVSLEGTDYWGRGTVLVGYDNGASHVWMCHEDLMKI